MNIITVSELQKWMQEGKDFQLIDVREANEWKGDRIEGAIHMPMRTVAKNLDKLENDKPVIFYCLSGVRSMQTIIYLQTFKKVKGLYNLQGGLKAWADQITSKMPK